MYLGRETVDALECYLLGYQQARADVGLPRMAVEDEALLTEFNLWLATKLSGPEMAGWCHLVGEVDPSTRNVRTFFSFLDEFLRSRGSSLEEVPPWELKDCAPR